LVFVIHFQNTPFLSICDGSSVSASAGNIAGSKGLEGRVGTAAIVAEFQGHPGDSAFGAAGLMPETS
jgi:hypothetical protein